MRAARTSTPVVAGRAGRGGRPAVAARAVVHGERSGRRRSDGAVVDRLPGRGRALRAHLAARWRAVAVRGGAGALERARARARIPAPCRRRSGATDGAERARTRGGARCRDPGCQRASGGEAGSCGRISRGRLRGGGAAPGGRLRRVARRCAQGREPAGARLADGRASGHGRRWRRCRGEGRRGAGACRGPDAPFRGLRGGRQRRFRSARRGDLRPAGSQRRRQVDHLPHAVRAAHAQRRRCQRRGRESVARREPRPRAPRLHGAEILALWRSVGGAEPRLLRRHLRLEARRQARAGAIDGRDVRARAAPALERLAPAAGLQAAPGARLRHAARPGGAVSR